MELGIPRTLNCVDSWKLMLENVMFVFIQLSEKFKKKRIQMGRRAKDIIHRRVHTLTLREYAEQEKKSISVIINDSKNCSNISFLREITH